jgi:CheY-like chemotaxis protein
MATAGSPTFEAPPPGLTILVVDDDAPIRVLMTQVLSARGFVVKTAANGREALHIVGDGPVDLVISDIVMPEQEGLETIRLLKQSHPDMPVLAMSGAFGGAFLRAAQLLGARAALRKPFAAEALLSAVEAALHPR